LLALYEEGYNIAMRNVELGIRNCRDVSYDTEK
jgi:hypothetical protein